MTDYWIKLYIEILSDPKMGTLPDRLWRRIIELFLMAGSIHKDGHLPDTQQIAWFLRMSMDDCELDLKQIESTGIIERTKDGWFIPNFAKRQAAVPDADRKKYQRERDRKEQYYGNAPVTNPSRSVTEIRSDTYTESNINGAGVSFSPTFRDAERLYCEVTKFATVTSSAAPMLDGLLSMLQDYGWDATLARCQSAFTAWTSRKRKDNGKPYSPTNPKWIEWAISGETDAAPESDTDRALRQMKEQAEMFS